MIVVARPINGVTINGLEFLLDGPNGPHMTFNNKEEAKDFLRENAFPEATDEELEGYYTFMTQEEGLKYEANNSDSEGEH